MAELNELLDRRRRPTTTAATSPAGASPSASTSRSRPDTLRPLPGERVRRRPSWRRIGSTARAGCRSAVVSTRSRSATSARRLDVRVGAETVEVLDGAASSPRHARGHQGRRDPGAGPLPRGPRPQARRVAWRHRARPGPSRRRVQRRPMNGSGLARRRLGDRDGTRALIEVLLLHRTSPADARRSPGSTRRSTVGVDRPGRRRDRSPHDADEHDRRGGRSRSASASPASTGPHPPRPLRRPAGGPMTTR